MNVYRWMAAAVLVCLPALARADAVTADQVQAALAELEKLAAQTLKQTGVPGIAITVVHKGEVIYMKGFGVREVGKPELIDADTVFPLASVSKPITSTILAGLVGEGKIGWDDRVIDLDPGMQLLDPWVTREVRVRDFLCHRSGLPAHAGDRLEDLGFERQTIMHRLRYLPLGPFRQQYAYTNFGYSAPAFAAAQAMGQSWEDLAEARLFRPLGMTSTSYRHSAYAQAKNRALLHVRVQGKYVAKYDRQPDAQAPAGGVSSTLRDLTHWLRLQLNDGRFQGKPLIAAAALAETRRPQIVTGVDPKSGRIVTYGLGWNVISDRQGRMVFNHSGEFSLGVRTEVALLPGEQLGIAVLCNAAPNGIPEGITESFFDLALTGKLQRDWVAFANQAFEKMEQEELAMTTDFSKPLPRPNPPLANDAYVGAYGNDYFGGLIVAEQDGKLIMRLGPKQSAFPLRHWDRDTFIYQPAGEMAGGPSGVTFTVGPNQKAARVLVEHLNVHVLGRFERVPAK